MLDTPTAKGVVPPRAATMVRMQIQPIHRPMRSQRDRQLKLCVPPMGVKGFAYRRVKNDVVDAGDLADLLRMGRLPEAWIAPPAVRELRELVRHRAKLVGLRTSLKCQVHAVLASAGIAVAMSDLFGVAGTDLLEQVVLPAAMRAKVESCRRVIDLLDFEIAHVAKLAAGRLHQDPGYAAAQTIPGVGPVLGAVFCAEIG